ncbi:MAG: efflux RND transporter periplasmic adaptor subunit [Bacteroidales bacterium]
MYRNKSFRKILLFFTLSFFISTIISCSGKKERKSISETNSGFLTRFVDTVPVQVYNVVPYSVAYTNTFVATLSGVDQANVVSKISEIITGQRVQIGDFVRKGQVVVYLDKGGSESNFYQDKATYEKSRLNYERMNNLYKDGAISLQSLDAARTENKIDSVNFEASQKQVLIESPISGVVTSINFSIGDLSSAGGSLMVVSDLSKMKASFFVDPSQLNLIHDNEDIRIFSDLNPNIRADGKISEVSKSGDPLTRKFRVQAIFNNTEDRYFLPDMFVKVEVDLKTPDSSLAIPQLALVPDEDRVGVYIIENNRAVFKNVETGLTNSDMTEVLTGLKRDDKVVVRGQNSLQNGTPVEIKSYPILNDSIQKGI